MLLSYTSCMHDKSTPDNKIVLLHFSTGGIIWQGDEIPLITKIARKISPKLAKMVNPKVVRIPSNSLKDGNILL